MIVGVGVDLCDVARLAKALARHEGRFEARVFTDDERAYCTARARAVDHYAARFAAKEAAYKAFGIAEPLPWRDVEVVAGEPPRLALHGRAAELAAHKRINRWHLSLSHDGGRAIAFVVAESTGD